MKKLILLTALTFCVALAGCSKDGDIDSFIAEFERVTQEMTSKIETGDIDGAKKSFDENKVSLQSSWDEIKNARGFQVTEESKKKLTESINKQMGELTKATFRGASKLGGDKEKAEELKTLLNDYRNIFQM